jgi:AraC-like DNA-binding protein
MNHGSRDRIEPVHLHRIAILRPFVQFLTDVGTPVERGFRQAGLPVYALEDMNNYVPSQRFWAFLANMASNQRIEDLGFRVGYTIGADCMDPHLSALVRQSPTLYQALLKAADLNNRTIYDSQMWMSQPPNSGHTYFFHSPSCGADNPANEQIGWFGLTILISMIRIFAGPHWQPAEIGMMTNRRPCHYIREQLWNTRMRFSQPYSYIALPNTLLSLPPLSDASDTPAPSPLHYDSLSNEFAGSFKQVLQTYVQESDLSIDFAAALCNTSKRSLQRKLAKSGTRYSEVLDQVRFHTACRMLQAPNIKVIDVAKRLGYSEPTHFSRAFRRIAGITPRAYRRQHTA